MAERLAAEGMEVVTAGDFAELAALDLEAGLDHYVQLPVAVHPAGQTLVGRVRSFLSEGLLGRFALLDRLLPVLTSAKTVVLVSGNTPGTTALPDDEHSRLALLHVLAHATRAELAPHGVAVTVVNGARTDIEIVRFALRGGADPTARLVGEPGEQVTSKQYEDWRTEVMGLVQVHT
ncbi:hypothetical protein [Pseudonocardia asaccharolytica]|uniref:Short-chain dehydrogenase n=1 Tax=Pseudonocardia asaccharolytica DSM 44247 = NBRC 16224 TaxID=1123024 RepID=A0A511D4C8_9PSEU|nr:hypothetical protein [Pseudonocardia asaccharolytica]GEL19631.1 hypothetical protein PA7_34680 [Pseudonocardia asaccharolytica DSM 44247 = NBRC 16224]